MSSPLHPTASYPAIVGAMIAAMRERKGFQQGTLAAAIGSSQSNVSRMERGSIPVSVEQLAVIASVLGTTPGRILSDADRAVAGARQRGMRVVNGRPATAISDGEVLVGAAALMILVAAALGGKK